MYADYQSFTIPVSNMTKKFLIWPFCTREKDLRTLPQVFIVKKIERCKKKVPLS